MSDFDAAAALVDSFLTNCAITRYLVENVADDAWRAEPPNGKGRTVAAIVAHIHNVRRMWLKAAGGAIPEEADRARITKKDAAALLDDSRDALLDVVRKAAASDGRVKGFKPDVAGFIGYHVSHEAHHRGQMAMLARQVGHGLEQKVMFAMWEWSNFSPAALAARASRPGSRKAPAKK
jgi:uncharacterized damage-inducible protein DinB